MDNIVIVENNEKYCFNTLEEAVKQFLGEDFYNLNDKDKVLRIRDHLDMAINCGVLVFGEDMRYHNFSINLTYLQQWYFNTKERRERKHEFIMRAREYHYQTTNFEGANTCDFEFSDALKQEIERRKAEKAKKEQLAKEEAKSQEK